MLDSIELQLRPFLLGQGRRLFDGLPAEHIDLELVRNPRAPPAPFTCATTYGADDADAPRRPPGRRPRALGRVLHARSATRWSAGCPAAELGDLTMLKLPGDEFVTLELVHDPTTDAGRARRAQPPRGRRSRTCTRRAQLARTRGPGGEPTSPDGSADFWTAWVTDPDGYRIELVQWPPGHPAA